MRRAGRDGWIVAVSPSQDEGRCRPYIVAGDLHTAALMSVVVLVADGARPDTLETAIASGSLPALARMREEGGLHAVTSAFPSVTGPAYAPFLMGRFPGPIGLPALRWFDRARERCTFPDYTRSYVGYQMRELDRDLDAAAPTIFELVPDSIAALNMIGRGLTPDRRIDRLTVGRVIRGARTHFSGNVAGWLDIDREIAAQVIARLRTHAPRFTFLALTGVDKVSHASGHQSPMMGEALAIVDRTVAEIRADAERAGRDTHIWVVSDHGHSRVLHHEDLAGVVRALGHRVMAHPWVFRRNPEVAVMVSGNAMAHLYLELARRERPWWSTLRDRWQPLVDALLARESVDLVLLPDCDGTCTVQSRTRGTARIEHLGTRYRYIRTAGDPLGIGDDVDGDESVAYAATMATDYPDAIVQVAHIASASRAGDVILSAARDWDFRAMYEPIPHVSSHGALHREHMMVPLLVDRPVVRTPRRTVDVMPSALRALGVPVPGGMDGVGFV